MFISRLQESCLSIRKKSPFSFVFLAILLTCIMISIRSDGNTDLAGSAVVGAVMAGFVLLYITSIYKTSLHIYYKLGITALLSIGGYIGWHIIQPSPTGVEFIHILITGCTAVLSIISIVGISSSPSDKNIHDWILHLIKTVCIAGGVSILLGGGLSLAFLAIESLFSISIDRERYSTVRAGSFIILGGITFLDGIIAGNIADDTPVPIYKRQRILARVLGFLLLVFGVILYTYIAKILLTRDRPSNEVTTRAFIYSGLIIVASIILLPIRQHDDDRLYRIRQRMYASVLPMCLVISIAIYLRVAQYGITVQRYLVIISLLWLTCISIYMIGHKRLRIYWIFTSLLCVGLFAVFAGPLNSTSIAYNSQSSRLTDILEQTGNLTVDGITLPLTELDDDESQEISSIVSYMTQYLSRGLERLDPSLTSENIYTTLGIEKYNRRDNRSRNEYKSFYNEKRSGAIDSTGYTQVYPYIYANNQRESENARLEDNILTLFDTSGDIVSINLTLYIQDLSLLESQDIAAQQLIYKDDTTTLHLQSIDLTRDNNDVRSVSSLDGLVLVK